MEGIVETKFIVGALAYSLLGLLILAFAVFIFDKLTPGNLWKEIFEEHNTALAIIVGSMSLAIAHIIASAIHG